jgi:hypothetical protein
MPEKESGMKRGEREGEGNFGNTGISEVLLPLPP